MVSIGKNFIFVVILFTHISYQKNQRNSMKRKFFILSVMIASATLLFAQNTPQTDSFATQSGAEIVIHPIKHGSLRLQYQNLEIEVDPVISLPPVTDYTLLPKADIILITHEHGDHLDLEAIKQLEKKETIIVANPNSAHKLSKAIVMKNGDNQTISGINIEAVPAYNTSPERHNFHPRGRDNGYVLTIDGLRIYIAGDTEDIPEMEEFTNIDIAFLPCNLPYTMTPEQTANAAKILNPKVLFPYHYGQTQIEKVKELLKDTKIDVRIRNLQ